MRGGERSVVPGQGGKIFNFALWATSLTLGCVRASTTPLSLNREVQLSTFNFQLRGRRPLVPLTLQSYNTGRAKSSIWAKRCRAAPRFPSAPPLQRAHCQPLSGKWAERTTGWRLMADARRGTSGTAGVGKWSKWSFGQNRFWTDRNATIIIKIYFYYYSEHKHTSKMKMTKMTMTTLTASKRCTSCLFLKKVDSIFTLKINISISVRNQLTLLAA